MQVGVSGYFLAEEIVIYFEVKKCSEILSCAAVGSRNRFSTAKSGLNHELKRISFYNEKSIDYRIKNPATLKWSG